MRPLVLAFVAVLSSGCGKARLEAERQRAEAAGRARPAVEASSAALEQELAALKAAEAALLTKKAIEEKQLRQVREGLVGRWNGDEALMRRQVEALGQAFPAALRLELDKAQAEAAHTAPERRFAEALERKDLPGAAATLLDWEVHAGFDAEEPDAEAAPESRCEKQRTDHPLCESFAAPAGPVLLCRVPAAAFTFAAWSDRGRLVWQRLEGLSGQKVKMARVLSPRVWLVETEGAAEELVVPHQGKVSAKRWLRAFELGDSTGTARVMLPLELHGKPAALSYADLDGDGAEELLYLADGDVRALHPQGDRDVVAWFGFDTCEKAQSAPGAPDGLKKACAARGVAAKE